MLAVHPFRDLALVHQVVSSRTAGKGAAAVIIPAIIGKVNSRHARLDPKTDTPCVGAPVLGLVRNVGLAGRATVAILPAKLRPRRLSCQRQCGEQSFVQRLAPETGETGLAWCRVPVPGDGVDGGIPPAAPLVEHPPHPAPGLTNQ